MRLTKPLALFAVVLLTGCVERHVEVPAQYPDDPSLSQQFVSAREPSNVEVPYEQTHHARQKQVARAKRAHVMHPTYRAEPEPIDPGANVPMDPPQPDELDNF